MWLMYFQRSDGGAVMKETTSLVFPIDATSKTLTHTFGGLDDNTRYNAWVTASSCAGDVDSSTDSAKTSLNIIIDDGSNDPLYLYWRLNITGVTLNTDAFSTDLFFAAVSTVLSENSLTISRTDMGVISFEVFEDVKLIMNTQLNVTVGTADAVGSVLESVSFPPCASELTRKLKDFSSSQFHSVCVSFVSFSKGTLNKLQSGCLWFVLRHSLVLALLFVFLHVFFFLCLASCMHVVFHFR
eukprot:m.155944 g.155944  ORF g.155944 m.155944 type:complete len:241 (+) comp13332_c0_seq3:128-850(+)